MPKAGPARSRSRSRSPAPRSGIYRWRTRRVLPSRGGRSMRTRPRRSSIPPAPDESGRVVKALEPTFGGINLEDIKAPECFYIEEKLKAMMDIPVFHDDQHGTAIISGAALVNAVELTGKRLAEIKLVISGAGASAISSGELFVKLGVARKNIMLVDTKGVVYTGRTEGMNPYKARFAVPTDRRTLADALRGADVFIGLSAANIVTREMVQSLADRPFFSAMANPDQGITYDEARAARTAAIVGTGGADFP